MDVGALPHKDKGKNNMLFNLYLSLDQLVLDQSFGVQNFKHYLVKYTVTEVPFSRAAIERFFCGKPKENSINMMKGNTMMGVWDLALWWDPNSFDGSILLFECDWVHVFRWIR